MKQINPQSNPSRRLLSIMLGVVFVAGGLLLMADFLFKFLKFVVGLVCMMIGIQYLWRR